jgi:hypothetical protein
MRKLTVLFALVLLAMLLTVGWKIAACELANIELQDDLRDLSSQSGARIGFIVPRSDDDLRNAIVGKAKEHHIELDPSQVMVERSGSGDKSTVQLAAKYDVILDFFGMSFRLSFSPSSS